MIEKIIKAFPTSILVVTFASKGDVFKYYPDSNEVWRLNEAGEPTYKLTKAEIEELI